MRPCVQTPKYNVLNLMFRLTHPYPLLTRHGVLETCSSNTGLPPKQEQNQIQQQGTECNVNTPSVQVLDSRTCPATQIKSGSRYQVRCQYTKSASLRQKSLPCDPNPIAGTKCCVNTPSVQVFTRMTCPATNQIQ